MWAEHVEGNFFRLRNVPFYVYGFSVEDVVEVAEQEGCITVKGVVERGGHSTYRIILPESASEEEFQKTWLSLAILGCTYERATRRLVAIDVPPVADVYKVYDVLEAGEHTHKWEFEEGHCGHALKSF